MTGLEATLARIDDIRTRMAALSGTGVATTAAPGTTSASGADFASSLLAATGSTAATTGAAAVDGDSVVADAKQYLGVPYRWGGTDPATGLDCSGLTQRVFSDLGVSLPRTVAEQRDVGTPVDGMANAKPGDLLVFGSHHIGIYVGNGKMLHAPHTGTDVKIAKVYETPTRIRRVVTAGDGVLGSSSASPLAAALRPTALRTATAGSSASTRYDGLFDAATATYGLPAGLLKSVARAESSFNPSAHSGAGAVGLMQLMPGTARGLGVDPRDPAQAVDGAARLLKQHLTTFGSVPLALAAYNAGPGAVRRYDGIPPYAETQAYVRRVTSSMAKDAA